jgi:hypothetical protein
MTLTILRVMASVVVLTIMVVVVHFDDANNYISEFQVQCHLWCSFVVVFVIVNLIDAKEMASKMSDPPYEFCPSSSPLERHYHWTISLHHQQQYCCSC